MTGPPESAVGIVDAELERLLAELGLPHGPSSTRSTRFEDLGLGSLELNELLARLERRSQLRFPADVLARADSAADLIDALSALGRPADAPAEPTPHHVRFADDGSIATGPAEGTTLVEVFDWHCARHPDRVHLRLLDEPDDQQYVTYADLRARAVATAAGLLELGVSPGDAVAIVLPTCRSYFDVFLGILVAGGVPVPVYPPARRSQLGEHLRRQVGILANCRAVALVTVPEGRRLAKALQAQVPTLRSVVVPDELLNHGRRTAVAIGPEHVAFVQYTSGSTGDPKGVVLTHANLLANIRAMLTANAVTSDDRFVSWLPLYHDMGLIGAWMSSMTAAMPLAVMSPVTFLRRPARWLWAIHENRGTISGGPNFAYARCLASVDDAEIEGLDLSSWRLAFNGAEPVSPDTLERFADRFAAYGLRPDALTPVYGLAEASVGLTFPPPGRGPRIDRIERRAFTRDGVARPVDVDVADALRFPACGQALAGHDLRIVDDLGVELDDRHQGHIQFRGPSATSGYLHNPVATADLFADGWLDTGDLGYLADGDLYVTGRIKDMIVRAGRNLHPSELEEAVSAVDGVRAGCVAVFGTRSPGVLDERLVVLAETRIQEPARRSDLRDRIVAACVTVVDAPPDEVVLVDPGTVPKTSSGKIRRSAARQLYESDAVTATRTKQRIQLARFGLRTAVGQLGRVGRQCRAWGWAVWVWTALALVSAVALTGFAVVPNRRSRRRLASRLTRGFAAAARVRIDVEGIDRLPTGPVVVVANHESVADGLVLATVLPERYTFVVARTFADRPAVGWGLRRLGVRFVDRSDRDRGVEDAAALGTALDSGESLVMFPEGHLAPAPGLGPFHLGAFTAAAAAGVPVTPVTLTGVRRVLTPNDRRPRRGAVRVTVHPPVRAPSTDWAGAISLRDEVRSTMRTALTRGDR